MARTIGTTASTSLVGFLVGTDDITIANIARLNEDIRGDPPGYGAWPAVGSTGLVTGIGTNQPRVNQAYVKQGLLIIPNRGHLQLKPGDFIGVDATTGWPIVVSGYTAANGPWSHT